MGRATSHWQSAHAPPPPPAAPPVSAFGAALNRAAIAPEGPPAKFEFAPPPSPAARSTFGAAIQAANAADDGMLPGGSYPGVQTPPPRPSAFGTAMAGSKTAEEQAARAQDELEATKAVWLERGVSPQNHPPHATLADGRAAQGGAAAPPKVDYGTAQAAWIAQSNTPIRHTAATPPQARPRHHPGRLPQPARPRTKALHGRTRPLASRRPAEGTKSSW